MNREQIADEVIGHQLNDTKYRPLVNSWISEGQRYIFAQTDLRTSLESVNLPTTAGNTLTLPTNYGRFKSLRNTDDADMLYPMELREYDDLAESSGKPTQYVIVSNEILLYPTPDAEYALTLRYWRLPADVGPGETPELPESAHPLLVRYCLMRAFARENDYEAAGYWRTEFENDLAKWVGQMHYDSVDPPTQVPGTWDDGGADYRWR